MCRYIAILLALTVSTASADDTTAGRNQNSASVNSQTEKPSSIEIETINFEKGIAIDSEGNIHKLSDLQKELGEDFNIPPKKSLMIDPDQEVMIDGDGNTYHYENSQKRGEALARQREEAKLSPLEDFATKFYFHGAPYDEAIKYKGQDCSRLLKMLRDPAWKDSWSTIVVVLGMTGDEKVVDHLISYIESDNPITDDVYHVKAAAITSLGYTIANHKSEKALKYLESGLQPNYWRTRKGKVYSASSNPSSEERNLITNSLQGLVLSESENAIKILENYRNQNAVDKAQSARKGGGAETANFEFIDDVILDEYITDAKKIKSMGLVQYSKRNH